MQTTCSSPRPSASLRLRVQLFDADQPRLAFALLTALIVCSTAPADEPVGFGSVSGQILYEGPLPELPPLVAVDDPNVIDTEVCADSDIPDESIIVNRINRGLANVVLFPIKTPSPIHPDLQEPYERSFTLSVDQCRYSPHIAIARTGLQFKVTSEDSVAHSTRTTFIRNQAFCATLQPNDSDTVHLADLTASEPLPMPIVCDVHPWMRAYLLVVDHSYAAITDHNGCFEIKNLPAGLHTYRIWHERAGYLDREFKIRIEPNNAQPAEPTALAPLKFGSDNFDLPTTATE